jgi:hypothetical protein
MKTPVALIIFNRPEVTRRVFSEIRRARPQKLLVIADGPRADHPADAEKCAATRAVIDRVDWECDILTNYSEVNLGCKMRPASGLSWVFEMVEEAIILEDDCLPHPSFFPFCEELLARYRDDERVMMISGTNLLGEWKTDNQSYHHSLWGASWGWASWRRAWRFFDHEIKLWPRIREMGFLQNLFSDHRISQHWDDIFQAVYTGALTSAWDYQWLLACWMQHGLRIFPEVNLISNIGFGDDATHPVSEYSLVNVPSAEISFPLKHPPFMIRSVEADHLLEEGFYGPGASQDILSRLRTKVAGMLRPSGRKTTSAKL